MNIINSTYYFYRDGFKNMTVGKTLWKIVFIKLIVILLFLQLFVHDKTLKSEYKTDIKKTEFVTNNLLKGMKND